MTVEKPLIALNQRPRHPATAESPGRVKSRYTAKPPTHAVEGSELPLQHPRLQPSLKTKHTKHNDPGLHPALASTNRRCAPNKPFDPSSVAEQPHTETATDAATTMRASTPTISALAKETRSGRNRHPARGFSIRCIWVTTAHRQSPKQRA